MYHNDPKISISNLNILRIHISYFRGHDPTHQQDSHQKKH